MSSDANKPDPKDLDIEARIRLYGKKSTVREIIDEIIRLALGDTRRHQEPLNNTQIGNTLGISREYIGTLIKTAIKYGLVEVGENGKIKKPEVSAADFSRFDNDTFASNPLVKDWLQDMLTRKNGKPKKTWKVMYHGVKNFCNTFKIKPEQLIIDKKTYLQILTNAKIQFDTNQVEIDKGNGWGIKKGEGTFHRMKMATRDFVQFHGVALPRNIGGVASGKVIQHGKYADIRLSDEEIEKAFDYIKQRYGLDSDIMRVFGVGVESGPRALALLNIDCEWEQLAHPETGAPVFVLKAYETKTESKWKKYIVRADTQQSLIIHKNKQRFKKIVSADNIGPRAAIYDTMLEQLREIYKFLGKEFVHDGYFMRKPFHSLRHIAAQYHIRKTRGNLTAVTVFCGWKSEVELRASYGELPDDIVLSNLAKAGAAA